MPLDQNPHQTVTRFGCVGFQCMHGRFSGPKMRQFYLFTYPPKSKWAPFEKNIFFAKIVKSNIAIFPSIVQASTQPYSFGGRIKLIVCQIRHDLSVGISEISSSWKKNVRWRIQYYWMHSKSPKPTVQPFVNKAKNRIEWHYMGIWYRMVWISIITSNFQNYVSIFFLRSNKFIH